MKFTKEQLLERLKAEITKKDQEMVMSARTFNSNGERLYQRLEKANSEDELDAVVTDYLPDFLEINKNIRKEKADFADEWKKNHPVTEPKPKKEGEPSVSETEKKLFERLEALEKKNAEYETAKLVSEKRSELLAKFKEKGIKDSKWIDAYMKKLSLTKDSDIDQEFTDAEEFYNLAHSKPGTQTPSSAGGDGGNDKVDFSDVVNILNPNAGK